MGISVGDIFMRLRMDSKGFNTQLKGMKGTALKAAATIGAAFSVKALANFSKQCLELGSDLQEVQNVVDVTFGNMSDKVNKFAQEAAKTSGLSETMAKKYAGTYGAMAKSFKFDPKATYDMSTALTNLTGDVASFYNLSQDEAYTKLKSVFTGETESLKDLGVVMTQTALDQYALANGFGKTTAAMTEQEKVALRYKFVTEQLGAAAGDFIRTQDSWANQTRILSLQMESFKAAIGQGLINILTPVIKWLNVLMEKLVAAANAFKTFTETLFGKRSSGPTQTTSSTEELDAMASSADTATAATNKTTAAAKKLKRELAGFDQITKLGSEEESSGSDAGTSASTGGTTTTTPSIDDGTADKVNTLSEKYGKLANSIDNLKSKFKGFTDLLSGAGSWTMENILKPLGNWTMNELAPAVIDALASAFGLLTTALEFLKPVWDWIWKNFLKPIANFAGDVIITALNHMSSGFKLLTTVLNGLKPIWDWIWKNLFEPIGNFVGTAITNFLDDLTKKMKVLPDGLSLLNAALEAIPGKIEELKGKVKKKWDALKGNIKGKTAEFKAKIATKKEDLKAKWGKLKATVYGKTVEMKAKVGTKWSDIKGQWNKLLGSFKNKTVSVKAKVGSKWSDLKGQWNKLLGSFKDKSVKVTLNIAGKVADIKKWFNQNVIDKVNSQIHKVPLLKGVSIPYLAQGGYVKKNTPQLAMIGDNRHYGEVVAPENKLQEMARMAAAGAGGTSPEVITLLREIVELLKALDLDVTVDGKSLMSLIVRLINQKTKATGKCPITV